MFILPCAHSRSSETASKSPGFFQESGDGLRPAPARDVPGRHGHVSAAGAPGPWSRGRLSALSCCHIRVSGTDSTSDPDTGPAGYGASGQGPLVSLPAGSGPALGTVAAPEPGVRTGKPSG